MRNKVLRNPIRLGRKTLNRLTADLAFVKFYFQQKHVKAKLCLPGDQRRAQ
jgi:hypothetical protein